jgi:hypothetical protein
MAPRFVLVAICAAFAMAVLCATITTVRQIDLQTWHSSHQLPDGGERSIPS